MRLCNNILLWLVTPEQWWTQFWKQETILDNLPVNIVVSRALSEYKDGLSEYGDFHYKDETVVRLSYLYNGNSYTGKAEILYWDGPLNVTVDGSTV